VNLCINARDAMPAGGRLEIQTRNVSSDACPSHARLGPGAERYVQIRISDTGCGMDADTLRQVFDPFFTTKPKDRGTGLGLAIVYKIVEAHNGVIDIASEPGKGTSFDVFFPTAHPQAAAGDKAHVYLPRGHEHILIVDDEEMIASLLKTLLESRGYEVTVAAQPEEAVELVCRSECAFDLAVIDHATPSMTGLRCLKDLRRARPDLKAILIAGDSSDPDDGAEADCYFVRKPFVACSIAETVREVLDR